MPWVHSPGEVPDRKHRKRWQVLLEPEIGLAQSQGMEPNAEDNGDLVQQLGPDLLGLGTIGSSLLLLLLLLLG